MKGWGSLVSAMAPRAGFSRRGAVVAVTRACCVSPACQMIEQVWRPASRDGTTVAPASASATTSSDPSRSRRSPTAAVCHTAEGTQELCTHSESGELFGGQLAPLAYLK